MVSGVELGWLLHDFAWGQVVENRRVAGGKLAGFLRSLLSVRIVRLTIDEKRAGVGRPEWQKKQEFRKRHQLDMLAPNVAGQHGVR